MGRTSPRGCYDQSSQSSANGGNKIDYTQYDIVGLDAEFDIFIRHNSGLKLKPVDFLPLFRYPAIHLFNRIDMSVTTLILLKLAFQDQTGSEIVKFDFVRP